MKTNKIGIHEKRNKNGFLSTLFGAITKMEHRRLNVRKVTITEYAWLDKRREKTLEANVKKSQAVELIRKLQNR